MNSVRVSSQKLSLGRKGVEAWVNTIAASAPGPVVVVTGNVHGDECTGVGVCLQLQKLLPESLKKGTIHLIPSLNPEGLERKTRRLPEEDADLNRVFPGDDWGTPGERVAARIWSGLCRLKPDLLIDLHADAPLSVPYTLLDRAINTGKDRQRLESASLNLAIASGLLVVHEYPDDRYHRFRLDRSLTGAALNLLKIPALTLECGPRLYLEPSLVQTATQSVLAVLRVFFDGEYPTAPLQNWRRESGPRSTGAGILVPMVKPGIPLKRGELIAGIYGLNGEVLEWVRAEAECIVLSFVERTHIVGGTMVATVAVRE